MLHIHNGDASAETAARSSIPGEHFAFREALVHGPSPAGLSERAWTQLRAHHLSKSYDVPLESCERELLAQDRKLASVNDHDEVILWFEHDLFCQVHLIYLLNWFAKHRVQFSKLRLICIGEFPDRKRFKGLGELSADELESLFPNRTEINNEQVDLAVAAWAAYSAHTPTEIEKLLKNETQSLPFLGPALRAHLRRFPSVRNGLGAVESTALKLINDGARKFGELFAHFGDEQTIYGFGDAQFWLAVIRMVDTTQPLLRLKEGTAGEPMKAQIMPDAEFEITALGSATLDGVNDFVKLNGIDFWLGGVHLEGDDSTWRWDEALRKIVNC